MSIQELERRWRSEPENNEELLSELLRLYERSNLEVPVDVLASTPRWRELTSFVASFYEEPIGSRSGNSSEELRRKEAELGFTLPKVLNEWYRLVGKRLNRANDLEQLALNWAKYDCEETGEGIRSYEWSLSRDETPAMLPIYRDEAALLTAVIRESDLELCDPPVIVYGEENGSCFGELSKFLIGMALRELLSSSCSGASLSLLGTLKPGLLSGYEHRAIKAMGESYKRSYGFVCDLPGQKGKLILLGDGLLLGISGENQISWCCAHSRAYESLKDWCEPQESDDCILGLMWSDRTNQEVVVLNRRREDGTTIISSAILGGDGRILRQTMPDGTDFTQCWTVSPVQDFAALKLALERELPSSLKKLEVAWRPENRGCWNVLWPPSLDHFVSMR